LDNDITTTLTRPNFFHQAENQYLLRIDVRFVKRTFLWVIDERTGRAAFRRGHAIHSRFHLSVSWKRWKANIFASSSRSSFIFGEKKKEELFDRFPITAFAKKKRKNRRLH